MLVATHVVRVASRPTPGRHGGEVVPGSDHRSGGDVRWRQCVTETGARCGSKSWRRRRSGARPEELLL
jgi:hypothetical protein